ncbi:hypothetical protein F5877DRAFT_49187 [Lentinula edodes]|nr:hypothetical protein F5877DRAFT_49187 [Lentinula edodes]
MEEKSEEHIKRPPNAFILFRTWFIEKQRVSVKVEKNGSALSTIIGLVWRRLPEDERQIWYRKAEIALEDHRR